LKIHKNITSLLRNIYFPLEKSSNDKISRCIRLVTFNYNAARKFYKCLADQVNCGPIVKFITKFWSNCISKWITKYKLKINDDSSDEHQAKKHKSNDGINLLKGISDIIYVLEIIANTWDQLTSTLNKKSNKPLNECILQAFNDDAITLMIKSIDSKDKYNLKEIIYKIASNVPSS